MSESNQGEAKSVPESRASSSVWNYFSKAKEGNYATCSRCGVSIQCKGGSTTAMRTHLKGKHGIVVPKFDVNQKKGILFEPFKMCLVLCRFLVHSVVEQVHKQIRKQKISSNRKRIENNKNRSVFCYKT